MIDIYLFSLLNQWAKQYAVLDNFFIFITHFGILIIALMIILTKNKKCLIHAFTALMLAIFIDQIINLFIYVKRPFLENQVNLLVIPSDSSSFPSGHTLRAFALGTALFFYNKKQGIIALLIALLVGISRIFAGVHYPSDALGGIIIGIIASLLTNYLLLFIPINSSAK
ncbi:phosphatase PAP2 family protein [Candidatus Woesearchaeota archaeon]|nr:phosphatase PAP2 family protein [Candidatus Woesearchaeota archaeon]